MRAGRSAHPGLSLNIAFSQVCHIDFSQPLSVSNTQLLAAFLRATPAGVHLQRDTDYPIRIANKSYVFRFSTDLLVTKREGNTLAYTLGELLGQGSFGSVYRSEQMIQCTSNNPVRIVPQANVVKIQRLEGAPAERDALCISMTREAEILDCFSQVRQLQRSEDNSQFWIITEFHEGRTLDKIDFTKISIEKRIALILDLCTLFGDFRGEIIHSDLKPANILYDPITGRAQIIDFGMAVAPSGEKGTAVPAGGTRLYMDIAAYRRGEITTRTDIYALGPVFAQIAGCSFRQIMENRFGGGDGDYNFNELDDCLPDWIRSERIRVRVGTMEIPLTIKEFLGYMVHPDARQRPDEMALQHFFLEIQKFIIISMHGLADEIKGLSKSPMSLELHTKIEKHVLNYSPAKRPDDSQDFASGSKMDKVARSAKKISGADRVRQIHERKRAAEASRLPVDTLLEFKQNILSAIAQVRDLEQRVEPLRYEKDCSAIVGASDDLIAKMNQHALPAANIAEKLAEINSAVRQKKEEIATYKRYIQDLNSRIQALRDEKGFADIYEKLERLAFRMCLRTLPVADAKREMDQIIHTIGTRRENQLLEIYEDSIATVNGRCEELKKADVIVCSSEEKFLSKRAELKHVNGLFPEHRLKSSEEECNRLRRSPSDITAAQVKSFSQEIGKGVGEYNALKENLLQLLASLDSKIFNGTNSSGIRAMQRIIEDRTKSPLQQLDEVIDIAQSKITGKQFWSRISLFGKGRHRNVETLYSDIAKLDGKNLTTTVAALTLINQNLRAQEFIHQSSCFGFCKP
jgi:serine/threonine protein kinase